MLVIILLKLHILYFTYLAMPPKENKVFLNLSIKACLLETTRSHATLASIVPTYSTHVTNNTPAANATPVINVTPPPGRIILP